MLHTSTHTSQSTVHGTSQSIAGRHVVSMPRILLHLEGLAACASAVALYAYQGWGWAMFFALLLAPDLAMITYLGGPKIGARVYNLLHFYALPLTLGMIGLYSDTTLALQIAAIWFAHIGIDRALGYGFKYMSGFKETHIARL